MPFPTQHEFELAYYDVAVQHVSRYTTRTTSYTLLRGKDPFAIVFHHANLCLVSIFDIPPCQNMAQGLGRVLRLEQTLGPIGILLVGRFRHQAINLVLQTGKSLVGQPPEAKGSSISVTQHKYLAASNEVIRPHVAVDVLVICLLSHEYKRVAQGIFNVRPSVEP